MAAAEVLPDFLPTSEPPRGRLHKAECQGCSYIVRVSAKWLDSVGPPVCPCGAGTMLDCRQRELLPAEAMGDPALIGLPRKYVRLRKSNYCHACQRFHDRGDYMALYVGGISGEVRSRYYCASGCDGNVQREHPGGLPPERR